MGLNPTGIIDKNTWFAIYEQPMSWRISAVKNAMENWKTIIDKNEYKNSKRMIVINIPNMKLYFYEKDDLGSYNLLMESKVVVGAQKTQTPLDDFDIISIKYNPTWTPTKNILKRNLYKNGELNIGWLQSHGLSLVGEDGEIKPYESLSTIVNSKFVQPSGQGNALGNLKFETTSKENIYLHDTNQRNLFDFNTRLYSSGCIRVKEYVALATYISETNERDVIRNIGKKELFFKSIPQKIPVYFDYSQVHFEKENAVNFFSDVYFKNR